MALGRTVARVSALVSPDTTKFARLLKAKLATIRETVDVKVTPDLDTGRLRAQLQALRGATIELRADVDTTQVKAELAALRGVTLTVRVDSDLTRFRAEMAAATRSATANVRVTPDLANFRRQLATATRRRPMQIDVTGNFGPFLNRLRAVTRNRDITLNVKLDTGGAMARFRALWAQLRAYAAANPIPLRFDIDRNHLQSMITRMFAGMNTPGGLSGLLGLGNSGGQGAGGLNAMSGAAGKLMGVLSGLLPIIGALYKALGILVVALEAVRVAVGVAKVLGDLMGLLGMLPALTLAGAAGVGVLVAGFLGLKAGVGNAKAVTDAFKSLSDEAVTLRNTVSDSLFADMAAPLRGLASVMPTLTAGLSGVASEMGRAARGVIEFVQSDSAIKDMATGLGNTKKLFAGLADAAINLAAAFADIAVVGSDFFGPMGESISRATGRFREFVAQARQSGQLAAWIQRGVDTFQSLWRILGNVKSTITGLFSATGAEDFLPKLEAATAAISKFVNSAEGSAALKAMFDGLSAGLNAILTALSDGDLPGMLTTLGTIFSVMGSQIAAVINALQWLGAAAMTVTVAIGELVNWSIAAGEAIAGFGGHVNGIISVAPALIAGIAEMVASVTAFVSQLNLMGLATGLASAALLLFQTAVTMAVEVASAVLLAFATTVAMTWAMVTTTTSTATIMVSTLFASMSASVQSTWNILRAVITSIVNSIRSTVQTTIATLVAFVQAQIARMPGIAQSGFGGFLSATASLLGQALGVARSTVSSIISAFSGLAGALYSAGANAMNGFISGFRAAAANALAVVSALASQIAAAARSALQINSPSRVFMKIGQFTAEGLAVGMLKGRPMISDAATKMALSAITHPSVDPTGFGVGAMPAGPSVVIQGNVGWDPDETARRISTAQRDALVMAGYAEMAVI